VPLAADAVLSPVSPHGRRIAARIRTAEATVGVNGTRRLHQVSHQIKAGCSSGLDADREVTP